MCSNASTLSLESCTARLLRGKLQAKAVPSRQHWVSGRHGQQTSHQKTRQNFPPPLLYRRRASAIVSGLCCDHIVFT